MRLPTHTPRQIWHSRKLTTTGRGLVHADLGDPREVQTCSSSADVVFDHPPDPGVVLSGHRGQRGDRHLLGEGEHRHLHEKGEPASGTSPGDRNQVDAVLGTDHPRRPGGEERLVLEEVQMPPALLYRVVHRTGRLATALDGTGEPRATRELQPDVELPGFFVKRDRAHPPRWRQPQSRPEHRE